MSPDMRLSDAWNSFSKGLFMIPFSVLDLAPILRGSDIAQSFRNTRDLARHCEALGYRRFWLAEHHNIPGVASAATAVVIGHVAEATSSIRVGAGGVMLPNHSPLVIAEQFGTLETMYPGRIDLGLGRAPGTDQRTAMALRRDLRARAEEFPQAVAELQALLDDPQPGQAVVAVPGAGTKVPLWLLGSSLFSAQLAALMGLPFAFASHFAPDLLHEALHVYRARFQPSAVLQRPYAMAAVNVIGADSDDEARYLFTTLQQQFLNLRRGNPGPLNPPVKSMEEIASPQEAAGLERALGPASVVGAPETLREELRRFIEETQVDELMVTAQIYDHAARLHSFRLTAAARDALGASR